MKPSRRDWPWHHPNNDDDEHNGQDPNDHDHGGVVRAQDWSPSGHQSSYNTYPETAVPCLGESSLYGDAPAYTMNTTVDYLLLEESAQDATDGQVLTLRGAAFMNNQEQAADFASSRPSLTFGGRSYQPLQWDPPTNGDDSRCRIFSYNISLTPAIASGTRKRQGDPLVLNFDRPSVWYQVYVTSAQIQLPSAEPPADPSISTSQIPGSHTSPSTSTTSISIPSSESGSVGRSPASSSSSSSRAGIIALAVIVPLLLVTLAALALLVWRRRQQKRVAPSAEFRAAMAQRFPDPSMAPMESDAVSIAETDLPGYAPGSSSSLVQSRGYVPGDAKRPVLGLQG